MWEMWKYLQPVTRNKRVWEFDKDTDEGWYTQWSGYMFGNGLNYTWKFLDCGVVLSGMRTMDKKLGVDIRDFCELTYNHYEDCPICNQLEYEEIELCTDTSHQL